MEPDNSVANHADDDGPRCRNSGNDQSAGRMGRYQYYAGGPAYIRPMSRRPVDAEAAIALMVDEPFSCRVSSTRVRWTSSTSRLQRCDHPSSAMRHSRLAQHSRASGAFTVVAAIGVRSNRSNFLTVSTEQLPISTTFSARSKAGTASTHSRLSKSA